MHPCPSCGAPLDDQGICTACGALSRGYFRGLDLGTPQLADAVARGLDFYLLLGVTSDAGVRDAARRYRQLRALFPDDPSNLEPKPARKLTLLELAGRVLTDPQLRRTYDALRADSTARVQAAVVRCPNCAAPFPADAMQCAFCGTPRPVAPQPPVAPPESGPPPTEPVDYYAMIGLTPQHLFVNGRPFTDQSRRRSASLLFARDDDDESPLEIQGPPSPSDVDSAALAREHDILLSAGFTPAEREARLTEIQIARRILRDERQRGRYDMLLLDFSQGRLDRGRLETLRHLQDVARAELADERGEQPSEEEGAALLKHGQGYLSARMPREAIAVLKRAVAALPQSAEAHTAYAQAIFASSDPLDLGGHMLRQLLRSVEAAQQLGAPLENGSAIAALCRGLLARDAGDTATAERELREATQIDGNLAAAWRALAALALGRGATDETLGHCRRALAIDARDERALLMIVAACLRANRRNQAREAAMQIAALRGEEWTADDVLREL